MENQKDEMGVKMYFISTKSNLMKKDINIIL